MKKPVVILLPLFVLLAIVSVSQEAEKADKAAKKPEAIQLTFPCDGTRGKVVFTMNINDSWEWREFPVNTEVTLKTFSRGITPATLDKYKLAYQFILNGVEKEVVWVDRKEITSDKQVILRSKYTYKEKGEWMIRFGLVDTVKNEWWDCTSASCTVK